MKWTIFSIDREHLALERDLFERGFKQSPLTSGGIIRLKGCYKGVTEYSWLCHSEDFNRYVLPAGFVDGQESILRRSECNKMYTDLVYLKGGERVHLGCMKSVTEEVAKAEDNWTYRPDQDQYYIVVKGNNDHYDIDHDKPQAPLDYDAQALCDLFVEFMNECKQEIEGCETAWGAHVREDEVLAAWEKARDITGYHRED